MDIASLSTALSEQRVSAEAAVRVQKMAMNGIEDQGAALVKMMESARPVSDPALGNNVDLLA